MFLNLDTYFTGAISLPQLPVSRMGEEMESYGMAKMIQSVGETNLETYIDEKAAEYLRFMFGDDLCNDILSSWFDYILDTDEVETDILIIDDSTEKNVWIESEINFDLLFSKLTSNLCAPTTDERFGLIRRIEFVKDNVKLKFKIRSNNTYSYYVSGDIVDPITIKEVHHISIPEEKICKVLNVVLSYTGNQKTSPVANYVWYHITKDGNNNTTSMGEADLNFSRATSAYEADKFLKTVTLRNKLITTWNNMVQMNKGVVTFIYAHKDVFTGYVIPYQNHKNLTETINSFNM
jgi:hypothetical protein